MLSTRVKRVRKLHSKLPAVAWRDCLRRTHKEAWLELLSSNAAKSSIHGLNQLMLPTIRRRMRLLWSLALTFAFIVLIYVSYLLAERYHRKHFKTIIAHAQAPMHQIAFPVLIVCNRNRLNWSRLAEMKGLYNITSEQEPLFERVLTAYDSLSFRHLDVFDNLEGASLELLNHLNFTEIATQMAWRCNELLFDCSWQSVSRNCCQLFHQRRLTQGICLSFNELASRRTAEAGEGTGLMVGLQTMDAFHAPNSSEPKGFVLNIVEPSVWFGYPIDLVPHTHMRIDIAISAIYHYYDSNTYTMPSRRRHCVLDYEYESEDFNTLQGHKYMLENCLAECHQLYMLRYCNCTLDLFYPPSTYPGCKLVDLPCLARHNKFLQNYEELGERPFLHRPHPGMVCECLNNCHSLTLVNDIRKNTLRPWEMIPRSQDVKSRSNSSRIVWLSVYYKRKGMLVYKTSLIYTWVDLLVSFGGICQLCLGCSIISLIELCYFGIVDVPRFSWLRYAQRQRF